MKRLLLLFTLVWLAAASAQAPTPVPTLTVPTLVPRPKLEPEPSRPAQSALADIRAAQVLRVGVLYNEPPYSALTLQGGLTGFDVELLRAIAELWGVELELKQVTRLNAADSLAQGEVQAVAAALLPYRDADPRVEFTQSYFFGRQAVMTRADSALESPAGLGGMRVGVVIGTRAEKALGIWRARSGIVPDARQYLTLDRAFAALTRGEVDALAGEQQALTRAAGDHAELARVLDEPLLVEPRAVAVRRGDAPMRNLLNRSIQRLAETQDIELLQREYFPEQALDAGDIIVWQYVGEEVGAAQFPGDIVYPQQSVVDRIRGGGALRVAGLNTDNARLNTLNRGLANQLAARWGVALDETPAGAEAGMRLLRSGAVDLVAGVKLDWRLADAVDFSQPYLLQGDRLLIPSRSSVAGFYDLRNRIVAVMPGDEDGWQRAQAWADSINIRIRRFDTTPSGAARTLLDFNNANAVYANSLALVEHLAANPNTLKLTERWYSHDYYAFALPYNDAEFRFLVDYTLQEMMLDGALERLSGDLLLGEGLPALAINPGGSVFAGINLTAR